MNGILPVEQQMDLATLWASQVNPQWLSETKTGLNAAYPGFNNALEAVQSKLLLDHFMRADAPRCLIGSLPDIAGQTVLQGTHFVQIEEAFDASKPIRDRYTDLHNPGRVLKLQLSDGKRSLVAIEHQFIPDLSHRLYRGGKAILEGPIRVERGALLLVPGNIWVIGGCVEELDAQMRVLSDAVMQQPVGRRGPQPTLEQYLNSIMHKIISTAGAAANAGAGPSGGVPQGGRPEQPVSPELQQSVLVPPQQRAPDSPRQLQQQQQQQQQYQQPPAVSNGANLNNTNLDNTGHVAVNHHVASTLQQVQQQVHGSISFGSGNVPPVGQRTGAGNALGGNGGGGQRQQQQHYEQQQQQQQQQQQRQLPNLRTHLAVPPHPSANGNHGAPQPPAADVDDGRAASSDEGWSSESEEEEADEEDNHQPGAAPAAATATATGGLFPQQQHQQQEEVIEILEDDDYEEETEPDLLPNDQFQDPNNTRILDSPDREDPIILLGTAPNAPTGAPPPGANTTTNNNGNNNGNKDDIESSSQEDGHRRELSIPYTSRSSSAKKKKKRKSTDPHDFRRSTSPQIMNARTEGGEIPPTEPQEHFLGGEAAGGGGGGNGNSSDKSKKQRLQSAGKSNTTTNIVVNAVMHHEEPSPRARAALLGNFNKASAAAVRSYPLPDLLMAQPPSLEQVKAGHDFEFTQFMNTTKSLSTVAVAPTPAVAPETAIAAAAGPQQQHHHQHQEIPEWGSQGPQPFTYIRHLANYVTAIQSAAPPPQQNLYLPISATICGFLKVTGTGNKRRLNFKVKVSDASGHVDAVLNEGLVLDYLNSFLQQAQETTLTNNNNNNHMNNRDSGHGNGDGGNVIVHLNTVEDFFSLRKANENLFRDAIDKLKSLLESHYGLTELMIQGDLGAFPEVVQLLDASLTASQIEMLRARVQGRGR